MSATRPGRPVPLVARLRYSADQIATLEAAESRADKRAALKSVHDDTVADMAPELSRLRADGVILDYATSWLLAELVAHAPPDGVAKAEQALSSIASLHDVRRGARH